MYDTTDTMNDTMLSSIAARQISNFSSFIHIDPRTNSRPVEHRSAGIEPGIYFHVAQRQHDEFLNTHVEIRESGGVFYSIWYGIIMANLGETVPH